MKKLLRGRKNGAKGVVQKADPPQSPLGKGGRNFRSARGRLDAHLNRQSTTDTRQSPWLRVLGARQNNLKNVTVEIPLGRFVCITGVSGSGKSSLVNDIIREALSRDLNGAENITPGDHDRIEGLEHLDKVIDIDQSPIGRTPRSNPATYIKVFDEIRSLYTMLPDAKVRGYKPGRFSFNVAVGEPGGGRCEACEGNGSNRMEMEFIADVWVTCPVCEGRRFSKETLQILYKGKSIADVLEMDVQEALEHFENVPRVAAMLKTLHDVGLDYIKLGQSSTTLSGGEAQRIKLARELVKKATGRTLYLLDEPTTGLHFADIKRLLAVLHGFVDAGNTVLVIEHNLDVVKTADWVIDLGPEGGAAGGYIVANGTPEQIAQVDGSHTGVALQETLATPDCRLKNAGSMNGRSRSVSAKKSSIKQRPTKDSQSTIDNRQSTISVVGARQNNLKNINVELPRGKTTVCCGPSGSGKSSFAIDTLYTEGQRRYVESLSSYARQFLGRLQPPKVDHVYGLSPAICIEQRNTSKSPRSTVGTVTEIYDYMRVLWARIGQPFCPKCRVPVGTQTADEITDRLLSLGEGKRVILLAPVEPSGSESYAQLFQRERANGYARVRINGVIHPLDQPTEIDSRRRHHVELVVDRIVVKKSQASRITDSVEQALAVGQGVMIASIDAGDQSHDHDQSRDREGADQNRDSDGAVNQYRDRKGAGVKEDLRFSQHRSCAQCGRGFDEPTPHHFSFNTRLGWCEVCEGLGVQQGASPSAIVIHPTRSIIDGALAGWEKLDSTNPLHTLANALANHLGFDPDRPWNSLTDPQQLAILQGCGDEWIEAVPRHGTQSIARRNKPLSNHFNGLRFKWRGFFPAIHRATRASWQFRKRLEELVTEVPCDACGGSRLRPESAAVRLSGAALHEICRKPLGRALAWYESLKLDARERKIAGELLHEIKSRLQFLVDVGLDYVTLHRTAATLSGGEAQRIQLASQIGTGLTGVLYVLDEPTIGLHPRDNHRLIQALNRLRDLGNTLVLVEHDREMIESADHILDFGPGAGALGGEVTADGSPARIRKHRSSLTGKYLSNREVIPVPSNRRPLPKAPPRTDLPAVSDANAARPSFLPPYQGGIKGGRVELRASARKSARTGASKLNHAPAAVQWLTVHGARENNLKEIDAAFPLARFTCVTGVSGSGKSTLVSSILYHALAARIHRASLVPGGHNKITGIEHIDKVINVDQSPIGTTPTSNPATYTGVFDAIRDLFAKLPLSKIRGYSANRFSFNRPGGRCEACEGMGQRCIEMHFLPDVWVECENCGGKRFLTETLEVRYREKSIADVLEMRVSESVALFENVPKIKRMLQTLDDVGLGYLQLGQSAATLSGGEAQRVKLAAELGRPSTGKTLYILDEPTTGLHFDDLRKLLGVLHRLVDLGNTVICIEHNLDVIKTADWVLDLGPEAGDNGGSIVAEGPPEAIVRVAESRTGIALRPILEAGPVRPREVFDLKRQAQDEAALFSRIDLGKDVQMPWERDGKTWHTVNHLDREGNQVGWDPLSLIWIVDTIESLGAFAETDWNHRARVEIKAPGDVPWFAHIRTGGCDLFEVALRVSKASFSPLELHRQLAIKTLDERGDLPIYGQWPRVRVRRHDSDWDEVQLHLRDFKDIQKTAMRAFLKSAVASYLKRTERIVAQPDSAEPWKTQGQDWHLSQKSIHRRQVAQWEPATLLALVGRFRLVDPLLKFTWSSKTAGFFSLPNEPKYAGKIVTNMGRGLRIELRAPKGAVTPAQVDCLGEDVEIRRMADNDWVIFWVRTLDQNDQKQLIDVWRKCHILTLDGELRSA